MVDLDVLTTAAPSGGEFFDPLHAWDGAPSRIFLIVLRLAGGVVLQLGFNASATDPAYYYRVRKGEQPWEAWLNLMGGEEPPAPPVPPVLSELVPSTAELDSPDFTLHVLGTGFTPASVIYFADQPEPIVFVSAEEITTVVKPSLGWGAVTVPVLVKNGTESSAALDFTFTEP